MSETPEGHSRPVSARDGPPASPETALGQNALRHLVELLRIDTSNPPGREAAAADYVAQALRASGLEPHVIEARPGRASVVARFRGTGAAGL